MIAISLGCTQRTWQSIFRRATILAVVVVGTQILAACGSTGGLGERSGPAQLTPPTTVLDEAATPVISSTPRAELAPFPAPKDLVGAVPGGRAVPDGPFIFYATLYRDSRIQAIQTASAAWLASDVAGIGVRLVWQYQGPEPMGGIAESWGPEGGIKQRDGYDKIYPGHRGGREGGGLLLPPGIAPGRRTWYGLRLEKWGGRYGVKLEFTVGSDEHGLTVTDSTVSVLRD